MKLIQVVVLILVVFNLPAQVSNNDISNRSKLFPEGNPMRSSTANSTVEWQCINQVLTKKCLIYHNDQWFNFQVASEGRYFINISSQKCRDLKGIQMILIEGNPCEISTYKILDCIPQIRQEDVFVELNHLRPGITYLVNVDGFLGDFCEFDIQLSSKPMGLPRVARNYHAFELKTNQHQNIVFLDWTLGRDLAREVEYFEIYRNLKGKRAMRIRELSTQANAYGMPNEKYNLADTLPDYGSYTYQIFGISKSDKIPVLLNTADFQYWNTVSGKSMNPEPEDFSANLALKYEEGTPFRILIYDRDRERELWQFSSGYNAVDHQDFKIFFDPWVKSVKRFTVLVMDGQETHEFYFRVKMNKIERE